MTLDEYQKKAIATDTYGGKGDIMSTAFINKILGLAGEAGEVAEKVKKLHRNQAGKLTAKDRRELLKELGDVLWYISAISHYLEESLDNVAKTNIAKLSDRKARGVIMSSGDNR